MGFLASIAHHSGEITEDVESITSNITKSVSHSGLQKMFANKSLYSIENSKLRIGDSFASHIAGKLKTGDFEEAFKSIGADFDVFAKNNPNAIVDLTAEYKSLPAYRLKKIQRLETSLREESSYFADASDKAKLSADAAALPKTSKVRQALEYISQRTPKTLTGRALTFLAGAGVVGVSNYVHEYANEMSGCFRFENVNGALHVCKVLQCSCHAKSTSEKSHIQLCTPSDLPDTLKNTLCGADSPTACKHCDSVQEDPHISNVNIEYRCTQLDFFGALAMMLGHDVDTVIRQAAMLENLGYTAVGTSLYGLHTLTYFIFVAAAVLISIYVYKQF